ncbi:NAC domain-containing protein 37-like [Tripterygium wilfordii]|nr:NAC domain-containing protein 37-like [Tripterygium wilfordii]
MVCEGEEEYEIMLPLGYRFVPEDHELILFFLHKKILDRKISVNIIRDIDLYNHDPHELSEDEFKHGRMNNEAYYFTQIDPEYTTKSSQRRSTKSGFWRTIEEDEEIVHEEEVIGFKKTLVFHWRSNERRDWSSPWLMHEYRVNPESSQIESLDETAREKMDRYVLCRIKLDEHD